MQLDAINSLDMIGWLQPKVAVFGDMGQYFFFKYILGFLSDKINELGFDMLARVSQFVGAVALFAVFLWILLLGYRVVTGQMRESMMGVVANMAKVTFIVSMAVSFGVVGGQLHHYLTVDMKNGIHELVTGEEEEPETKIDEALGWMQVGMSSLDVLETANDPDLVSKKETATFFIGLGTGGPAVVAGSMLLLYKIALALFIGLGPLFILCLLFDYTKGIFQKWLFYGIGTMFSMAMLSAMVSIALDMVTRVALAMWGSMVAGNLLLGENVVGGMNSMAMQQGGMGLILTTLILTAPPMAAMFFNGTLGNFAAYATMGAHLGQGQPQRGTYSEAAQSNAQVGLSRTTGDGKSREDGGAANYGATPNYASGRGPSSVEQPQYAAGQRGQAGSTANSSPAQGSGPTYTPPSPPPKNPGSGRGDT